jgi:hypothetical protein
VEDAAGSQVAAAGPSLVCDERVEKSFPTRCSTRSSQRICWRPSRALPFATTVLGFQPAAQIQLGSLVSAASTGSFATIALGFQPAAFNPWSYFLNVAIDDIAIIWSHRGL